MRTRRQPRHDRIQAENQENEKSRKDENENGNGKDGGWRLE